MVSVVFVDNCVTDETNYFSLKEKIFKTFCEESLPHNTTSENKDPEVAPKEFLSNLNEAVEAAIDHQQNSNATEPLDVPKLMEFKEMLRTINGTDLDGLQAQHKDAMRHGRLDYTLADLAKSFNGNKQKELKQKLEADANREKMWKKFNQWVRLEALKKKAKKEELKKKQLA